MNCINFQFKNLIDPPLDPAKDMAPEIPDPTSGDWTIVSRRRRGRPKPHQWKNQLAPGTRSPEDPPSPWIPLDPFVDHEQQSKLLRRMESTIQRLERSPFYRRFLHRLRGPLVQRGLARALSSASEMRMVVYGIGSIESSGPSRLQLALAVLLRRDLGPSVVPSLEVFDPVLSATECAVLAALGGSVIPVDERGRRVASEPTLFYMPHCEASLYDGLLEANWRPSCLNRMVVLGNSFTAYDQYVELGRWAGSTAIEMATRRLLQVRRYATEVEMEEKGEAGAALEQKQDEEDGIFKAFHDTNWHFFELDDEANLNFLKQDFCG